MGQAGHEYSLVEPTLYLLCWWAGEGNLRGSPCICDIYDARVIFQSMCGGAMETVWPWDRLLVLLEVHYLPL